MVSIRKAIVVDSVRSGITKSFRGKLRQTRPDDLAAQCVNALLARNNLLSNHEVDDCILGCAFPEGAQGMNIGRNVAILSDLSSAVSGTTVNRYCASGLQALAVGAQQIQTGGASAIIAGGVESISMTMNTINTTDLYNAAHLEKTPGIYLGMDIHEGKTAFIKNVFNSMGNTAEVVASKYAISRESQDEYAALSQSRIALAKQRGYFEAEIVPLNIKIESKKRGEPTYHLLAEDECNRPDTTLATLANLAPSFKKDGTVTAGNSSQITDGASVCLLANEAYVERKELPVLGYFHGYSTSGCAPECMGIGPVGAIKKLLNNFQMSLKDIDVFEINEAFAATTVYCQQALGIPINKLNPNGGAISMGHPFGMTGARQVGHILRELKRRDGRFGIVSMCVGGGMGVAALVEAA